MALLTCDFDSESLGMGTSMTVVLPELSDEQGRVHRRTDPPVLYLLHGLSDDHLSWLRWTSAARYAEKAGLALVMPSVARSFYADEVHGHAYWRFVSEELPRVVSTFFGLSQDPASTYVAGLSMGGYGALKLALRHPERFAAAASMSGALDLVALLKRPDRDDIRDRVFGGLPGPDDDLLALLDQPNLPRMWVGCGTEDSLFGDNETFVARADERGHDVTVDFRPGIHEWGLWDAMLAEIVPWLTTPTWGAAGA
jgi:putative tributyrin esterase